MKMNWKTARLVSGCSAWKYKDPSLGLKCNTGLKALQLTANPLRGLSAAELGRYVARLVVAGA